MAGETRAAAPYVALLESGEISARTRQARGLRDLDGCRICPRQCGAGRSSGEAGSCGIAGSAVVSSVSPHFGEEPCLVGRGGSGTIFFAGCNLHCIFCQNSETSASPELWREAGPHELASFMLSLEAGGVENLNLVTPSHVVPEILAALELAAPAGLELPIVFNTGGYDRVETLRLLDGIVSIYMPDLKYADASAAGRYSNAEDYPRVAKRAIREMHRQVGDLVLDDRGLAVRGLLVRHLVLPGGLAGTEEVVRFLAEKVSPNTAINVMAQYRPEYRARAFPELCRRVTGAEYLAARDLARDAGLRLVDDL
jgi:putative pyruvate formate lyase activating enzyme